MIERYALTASGHMLWWDFANAAQQRLSVEAWRDAFTDQTAVLPSALAHYEREGSVPHEIWRYLSILLPVQWNPPPRDPELSALVRIGREFGIPLEHL